MAAEVLRVVVENGRLRFVYDDALAPLLKLGAAEVHRVSHVEPLEGGWCADMRPSGGPVLLGPDSQPFPLRADALEAERRWLADTWGL